jgi:hypothetical protein
LKTKRKRIQKNFKASAYEFNKNILNKVRIMFYNKEKSTMVTWIIKRGTLIIELLSILILR